MLTPGNVAYATLDGRPGAYNFDHNQELQHWVSATDIRSTARLKIFNVFIKIFQGFLCAIWIHSVTRCSVTRRCCSPTTTPSPTSSWVAGASVTATPTSASQGITNIFYKLTNIFHLIYSQWPRGPPEPQHLPVQARHHGGQLRDLPARPLGPQVAARHHRAGQPLPP